MTIMTKNSNPNQEKTGVPQKSSAGRFSYSQRFVIITLIFTIPILAFIPFAYEQILRIDRYGFKEEAGTQYLRSLWQLTSSVQNYQDISVQLQNGTASSQNVDASKSQVENDLQTLQTIEISVGELAQPILAENLTEQWNDAKTNSDIGLLLENISLARLNAGDASFLILDPDLDTYYLMDAVLLKLPDNQNLIYKAKLLINQAVKNNGLGLNEEIELRNILNAVTENLNAIERGLLVASDSNTNKAYSPELKPAFENYREKINEFSNAVQQNLLDNFSEEGVRELEPLFNETRIQESEFYSLVSKGLESGIQNRTSSLIKRLALLIMLSVASSLIAFTIGNRLIKSISTPLERTIEAANELIAGNLSFRIKNPSTDEVGKVMEAFNRLADEVLTTQTILQERSEELTDKTLKLETIAKLSRQITSIQDLSTVLSTTTTMINENFGYYHVGIFLLDSRKEYAVLTASNSIGGKRMMEDGHQLRVGETGIVGYVAQSLQARIALDVGKDAVYFNNTYLPNTRSEMALPLVVSGQALGVLDVQSDKPQAFNNEDVSILQILAEQIAVAIQNANLFSQTQKALEAARVTYGQLSREAWSKILRNQARIGFIATPPITIQIQEPNLEPSIAKAIETGDLILGSDGLTISVPVKIRGQVIGAIRLKKSEIAEAWTQDETNLAIALADQLSGAMESARLYRESQQRAARESLVSDISARMTASSNMETILRDAVQELGQAIGNASVTFQLLDPVNGRKQAQSQRRGVNASPNNES